MLNMASKNRLIDNFLTSNEQYCTYTCMCNLLLLCNLLLFLKLLIFQYFYWFWVLFETPLISDAIRLLLMLYSCTTTLPKYDSGYFLQVHWILKSLKDFGASVVFDPAGLSCVVNDSRPTDEHIESHDTLSCSFCLTVTISIKRPRVVRLVNIERPSGSPSWSGFVTALWCGTVAWIWRSVTRHQQQTHYRKTAAAIMVRKKLECMNLFHTFDTKNVSCDNSLRRSMTRSSLCRFTCFKLANCVHPVPCSVMLAWC